MAIPTKIQAEDGTWLEPVNALHCDNCYYKIKNLNCPTDKDGYFLCEKHEERLIYREVMSVPVIYPLDEFGNRIEDSLRVFCTRDNIEVAIIRDPYTLPCPGDELVVLKMTFLVESISIDYDTSMITVFVKDIS